jgi:hypothetical protein
MTDEIAALAGLKVPALPVAWSGMRSRGSGDGRGDASIALGIIDSSPASSRVVSARVTC